MSLTKPFHFKKFFIRHDRCAMKVGTDAVLLGAWMNVSGAKTILDIGTGSGVIALMAAQRTNDDAHIDAIEIEKADAVQAQENVLHSPWPNKISVHQTSLQKFENNLKYDFIFSNPPYFNNSLLSPTPQRSRVRHTHNLTYDELINHSLRLLRENGNLAVILPYEEGILFKSMASQNGLHLIRQMAFYSRKEKPQERWLLEFAFTTQPVIEESLVLYQKDNLKSADYIRLTEAFYR